MKKNYSKNKITLKAAYQQTLFILTKVVYLLHMNRKKNFNFQWLAISI